MQTFIVVSDAHLESGMQEDSSYSLVKRFIKSFRPDTIYLNGDILDFSYLSSYNEAAELLREGKRLQDDYSLLNRELDFFQRYSKKVVYLAGNHETRAERFINKFMNLGDLLSIPYNGRLKERGISWIGEDSQPINITKDLLIAHGIYFNVHFAKKTVETMGESIIVGHTHRRQEYSFSYYGGRVVTCYGLGCLCDTNPSYMKSKNSGHTRSFGIGYISSSSFSFHNILIDDGFIWEGKLWKEV